MRNYLLRIFSALQVVKNVMFYSSFHKGVLLCWISAGWGLCVNRLKLFYWVDFILLQLFSPIDRMKWILIKFSSALLFSQNMDRHCCNAKFNQSLWWIENITHIYMENSCINFKLYYKVEGLTFCEGLVWFLSVSLVFFGSCLLASRKLKYS